MITLRADRSLICSDAQTRRHLAVELRAPEAPTQKSRLPVNLAFVIDRSGSMHGEKLVHARQAVLAGIRSLREGDRFAVVTYDDCVDVVVPGTDASPQARDAAVRAVEKIPAGGSTDLHGGWQKGCEQIAEQLATNAVGRCLLLTDGLANAGETDHDEIVRQGANWRDRRVVTTTFGVGADFDETLLRRLSDAGGGNFQFIESAAQIADFVASEVGEALATTVREAVLVVDAGPGSTVESLNDFPCRREGVVWRVAIGSLYSSQLLTPVLRVTFPEGEAGKAREVDVRIEDQDRAFGDAAATARFIWASKEKNDRQPRDVTVDRLAATLEAARAERDALERNKRGNYAGARQAMEAAVDRIRQHAGDDREIGKILDDLRQKAFRYESALDSISSKTLHSFSSGTLRGRWPRPAQTSPSASNSLIVPSEWDIQTAVAEALRRIASANASLSSLDVSALAPPLSHLAKRGCLLDPSVTEDGYVELHFQSPDFCRNCRRALESGGMQSTRIAQIAEALRLLGAPSGVVH